MFGIITEYGKCGHIVAEYKDYSVTENKVLHNDRRRCQTCIDKNKPDPWLFYNYKITKEQAMRFSDNCGSY